MGRHNHILRSLHLVYVLLASTSIATGCGQLPGAHTQSNFETTSSEEEAILAVVNDPMVTLATLDHDISLDRRAAEGIDGHRSGADGDFGTPDDDPFDDLAELDAIAYVGKTALQRILDWAIANGYYTDDSGDERDRAILAVVNDGSVTEQMLDDEVGLDSRAAAGIVEWRDSVDGAAGTADDRLFMSIEQLDAISYVGDSALAKLLDWAMDNGYYGQPFGEIDVIMSPQSFAASHNARIKELIDSSQTSLDIAMYSFSDAPIYDALEAAAARGVKVRFVFETANADRKLSGADFDNSRSARLEKMGINVRYVNKIMHHKFVIVDGPRDDLSKADTATVATGSGNWSYGAAVKYDENTVFYTGMPKLTLLLQREFNLMWEHSRDFVYDSSLAYELSTVTITPADLPDDSTTKAVFTSANFNASGDTFSIVTGSNEVSDAMVTAIENATDSILVASGHLRSRPISEALMAKAAANPQMDIRIYLDGQEYISSWYHSNQLQKLDDCLAAAGTSASKIRKCYDVGFYFGYQAAQSGIDVRYKYYSYRWHYKYALQMHHKTMIVDSDELWAGSYNLSNNAEHNTLENMLVYRGHEFRGLIGAYEDNFETLWSTRRDDTYDSLINEVETAAYIPLIFDPMALDWDQVTLLKGAIRDNCPSINTDPFRKEPWLHPTCPRN